MKLSSMPYPKTPKMQGMSNVSERLELALKAKPKLSKAGLARACDISAPSVSDWFSGKSKSMKPENLVPAARYLGVRVEWLATGEEPMRPDAAAMQVREESPTYEWFDLDSDAQPIPAGHVPLINMVKAGNWTDVVDLYQPGFADDFIPAPRKNRDPHMFALRVDGASMENPTDPRRSFHDGDLIYVSPGRAAVNGSLVIAKMTDTQKATFKELVIEGDDMYLRALNPSWPDRIMKITGKAVIVGVVIGKYIEY